MVDGSHTVVKGGYSNHKFKMPDFFVLDMQHENTYTNIYIGRKKHFANKKLAMNY